MDFHFGTHLHRSGPETPRPKPRPRCLTRPFIRLESSNGRENFQSFEAGILGSRRVIDLGVLASLAPRDNGAFGPSKGDLSPTSVRPDVKLGLYPIVTDYIFAKYRVAKLITLSWPIFQVPNIMSREDDTRRWEEKRELITHLYRRGGLTWTMGLMEGWRFKAT